jgi:hypothetical protein
MLAYTYIKKYNLRFLKSLGSRLQVCQHPCPNRHPQSIPGWGGGSFYIFPFPRTNSSRSDVHGCPKPPRTTAECIPVPVVLHQLQPGQQGFAHISHTIELETCDRCKHREHKQAKLSWRFWIKASKHTLCEICHDYQEED